jgi:hypothetical protein
MARTQKPLSREGEIAELLKDILIVQLGMAGVPQQSIRGIVGCDINRVNRIAKFLKRKGQETKPAKA